MVGRYCVPGHLMRGMVRDIPCSNGRQLLTIGRLNTSMTKAPDCTAPAYTSAGNGGKAVPRANGA